MRSRFVSVSRNLSLLFDINVSSFSNKSLVAVSFKFKIKAIST